MISTFSFELETNVPAEMRGLNQWLLWRLIQKDGQPKPSKVPYSAQTGQACNPTDSTCWASFDHAMASLTRQPNRYQGLGFALNGGIICIDLDNALDADGSMFSWAADILQALPSSYCEVSQSGHGVHWFGLGFLPGERTRFQLPKSGQIEIYQIRRFIAMTGNLWQDSPMTLADGQDAINRLYGQWIQNRSEKSVVERMFASQNGREIRALWDGDTSAYHGDQSAADLALLAHLAFWTQGNASDMQMLFSHSVLGQRDKWRQRADYRERSITKALEGHVRLGNSTQLTSNSVSPCQWTEPEPIPDGLLPVPEFEPLLLPELFRPWLCDVADRLQCPLDYPSVGAMAVLASIVGRQMAIRPKMLDSWTVIPNLWAVAIGPPSIMKTPALQEPLQVLYRLEKQAAEDYKAQVADQDLRIMIQEEQRRQFKKTIQKTLKEMPDPIQAVQHLKQDMELPEEPTRQRFVVNDATVEKLGVLLSENANGLLIFRDELAGFLNSLDKLGHETDRAFYLESWNGSGRFVYDRIGRGTVDIEAACVSLLGGIQPGPLQGYLSGALSGQHGDDGLMQRFQLAVWPSVKANWQNVDRLPDAKSRENAFARLVELSQLLPEAYGAEMDNHSPFPFLRFDAEAQELFTQWRTELEHKLRSSQEHPAIVAHLAKYRSLIPSLALLCHLVDGHIGPVRVGALERACAWGDFLEAHALKIYGYTIRQDYDAASRLLKRIKKGDLSNPFTTRDVYRNGWTGLTTVETAQRAIDALEDLGYVQSAIQQTPGRQKTIYWIHPMVMDGQFL